MAGKKNNKARQYKPSTIRRLDTLSGNECSSPDCDKPLVARDDKSIISKICHIEAASSDGPRYNPNMTDDERRGFNNLILLCDECHTIIDNKENENEYPVSVLKDWKEAHQSKIIQKLQTKQSLLKMAIDAIAEYDLDDSFMNVDEGSNPFNIDHKIQYNMVVRNRPLINEYKVYYNKVSTLYDELEAQGSFKKDKLLNNIRRIYLKVKGKYVNGIESEIDATEIQSSYVSPLEYKEYNCSQISMELRRVNRRTSQLHGQLDKKASDDAAQMGIGMILFWPALFFLEGGDGPEAAEYAQLKGEFDALEDAAIMKECGTGEFEKIRQAQAEAIKKQEPENLGPELP